jgi:non-heme chloroperoxidase
MVSFGALAQTPSFGDARLSGGVRLHYAQQGPRTGPAVLMLHGYTDSWFSFSRVLPLMPADLRIIVPDQRGHGNSTRPQSGYGLDDFAEDAIQLMDLLEVPKATVVGHSFGSFVARRMASFAPSRVHRLVLVGAAASANNASVRALRIEVGGLTDPVDPEFARSFQLSCVHRPIAPAFLEAVVANSQRMPAELWQTILGRLMDDPQPQFAPQCPTLVLGGRQDQVFPISEQMALAREIPGAALELVDEIGHTLHWEDPERFVAALQRFGV